MNGSLLRGILSIEAVQVEMARINMDDDEGVPTQIGEALTSMEQNPVSFNATDEIACALGMSPNTDNLEPSTCKYKTRQSATESRRY